MEVNISKTFLFFGEALLNFAIIVIASFILFNLFKLAASFKKKPRPKFRLHFFDGMTVLMVSGFSLLGFAIGLLVGFSISPVVHVVIPALLTFYGGFLTYLFSKDSSADPKRYIGILLSAMSVSFFLIYGIEVGSKERSDATVLQKKFDMYYLDQEEAIKHKYK